MQRLFAFVALVALASVVVASALAASPGTNGQPSQSCLSSTAPMEPGQAALAPGSAFNEASSTIRSPSQRRARLSSAFEPTSSSIA